jgi:hypothetical protein
MMRMSRRETMNDDMTAINFRFAEGPPHVVGLFDLLIDQNGSTIKDCSLINTVGPYWVAFPSETDASLWSPPDQPTWRSILAYFTRTKGQRFQELATQAAVAAMGAQPSASARSPASRSRPSP